MGLYIYGINQELSKTVPDLDELNFLAGSVLTIADQLKTVKNNKLHHSDLNTLLESAIMLKSLTRNKKREQAIYKAQHLINTCGQCHKRGSR